MPDTIASKLLDFVELDELAPGRSELCGVILADGDVMQLTNIHPEPDKGFHIDPAAFLVQVEAGATGTWHTHPGHDPNLSEEDMTGFQSWPKLAHHIVGIRDGQPTVHSFKVLDDGVVVNA